MSAPPPIPAGAITGNIVQSFQEDDGKTYVYLDKGSAAKLRLNMKGTILLGKEGGQPMDGGSITIVKILGESQAKAVLDNGRSPGRNTRFMFQAKK